MIHFPACSYAVLSVSSCWCLRGFFSNPKNIAEVNGERPQQKAPAKPATAVAEPRKPLLPTPSSFMTPAVAAPSPFQLSASQPSFSAPSNTASGGTLQSSLFGAAPGTTAASSAPAPNPFTHALFGGASSSASPFGGGSMGLMLGEKQTQASPSVTGPRESERDSQTVPTMSGGGGNGSQSLLAPIKTAEPSSSSKPTAGAPASSILTTIISNKVRILLCPYHIFFPFIGFYFLTSCFLPWCLTLF